MRLKSMFFCLSVSFSPHTHTLETRGIFTYLCSVSFVSTHACVYRRMRKAEMKCNHLTTKPSTSESGIHFTGSVRLQIPICLLINPKLVTAIISLSFFS